ncbi:glycosyltransferase [Terrimonas sp. NA20]|uniref:Glycosyltransferase n=1 Tax=Terrimonas ginsenosidimutans TaxID=2908004 RepID=A0ABS9L0J9_9BACT|nr:glycosyltransferase [Terrimonas ginsenosidimutans]MCG2618075.1 glycosyltransferase [Terrimonas ginsenosidimutans]
MKVIFSTGHGRLHIVQSAVSVKKAGCNVVLITGWVPGKHISEKWINRFGRFLGRSNLASGLKKRSPKELSPDEIRTCGSSEFVVQILFKLSAYRFFKRAVGAVLGWRLFGWQSKKYISNAEIFHVRSGAGRGGAIKKARQKGMKIVVDHSISHPKEMEKQLLKSAGKGGIKHNHYLGTWPSDKFWRSIVRDCEEADVLVVNSEYVKWSFVIEGYEADKIKVVPLGVSTEFGSGKLSYQTTNVIKLVFTGAFGSRKGASIIIEALEILEKKGVKYSFEVIGSVMGDIVIPDWVNESDSIKFYGHLPQSEMIPLLTQSDIYIFPTYSEGSAQSVKEAMALGLPVITTQQCGSPITHLKTGMLISDGDASQLAEAILQLREDKGLRESIGKQAALLIKGEHTWENYGEKMVEIYKNLL